MSKQEKKIDAVKLMRSIREDISCETENMSYEELRKYIDEKTKNSKTRNLGKKENTATNSTYT